jgi:hypothetical protein
MAKDISRKKLKRVLSDIDNGVYNNPQVFSQHSGVYKVLNETGKVIYKGSTVTLEDFKGAPTYESAVTQMLSGSVVFGSTNAISSPKRLYVKARETILPGKIGVIDAPNIFVAKVKINSDSHQEVSYPVSATYETKPDKEGHFYLVAKSPKEGNYAICAFGVKPDLPVVAGKGVGVVETYPSLRVINRGIVDIRLVENGQAKPTYIIWGPEDDSAYGVSYFSAAHFQYVPTRPDLETSPKMIVIKKTGYQCVTSIAVVSGAIEFTFGTVYGVS